MFSQACVKNCPWGEVYTPLPGQTPLPPPPRQTPPGQTLPRQTPPPVPPPDGHCSGRYASYWNASLLSKNIGLNFVMYEGSFTWKSSRNVFKVILRNFDFLTHGRPLPPHWVIGPVGQWVKADFRQLWYFDLVYLCRRAVIEISETTITPSNDPPSSSDNRGGQNDI